MPVEYLPELVSLRSLQNRLAIPIVLFFELENNDNSSHFKNCPNQSSYIIVFKFIEHYKKDKLLQT